MRLAVTALAVGGLALAAGWATGAAAQDGADFYRGKTLNIIITSGTGGSVDLMGRLGARHVGRHIPGNPTVVARNMGGAGGIVGMNHIYTTAPKDGTEIGTALNTVPFEPLFYGERSVAKFDPLKFNWIGSPTKFIAVAIAWHTSPIKKWQDLLEREMIVGSSGISSASTVDSFVMRNLLGFKYRVIMGYPSGSDIDLAMVRGETEGRATTAWDGVTSRNPDWITDKKITVLYQMGIEKHPTVPAETPLLLDELPENDAKKALRLKMMSYDVGYPIFAPPEAPSDRVAALRKAYADAFSSPEFLAEAKKLRVEVNPISGERLEEMFKEAYSAPAHIRAMLVAAAQPPGAVEEAKTVKATAPLSEVVREGRTIVFAKDGKQARANIARDTKITVGGKEAKQTDLKAGMTCEIDYYGDMGQATAVSCK